MRFVSSIHRPRKEKARVPVGGRGLGDPETFWCVRSLRYPHPRGGNVKKYGKPNTPVPATRGDTTPSGDQPADAADVRDRFIATRIPRLSRYRHCTRPALSLPPRSILTEDTQVEYSRTDAVPCRDYGFLLRYTRPLRFLGLSLYFNPQITLITQIGQPTVITDHKRILQYRPRSACRRLGRPDSRSCRLSNTD